MAYQAEKIFVNLPVKDLQKTMDFFAKVGFSFDSRFCDEKAACLVMGENLYAMLVTRDFFQTFTQKGIADTAKSTEVIVGLSANSKEQVDEVVKKALDAGGTVFNETVDHGFMYVGSFEDPDGHLWEIMYMDESAMEQM